MIGLNKKHSLLISIQQQPFVDGLISNSSLLVPVMFVSMFFTTALQAAPAKPSGVRIDVHSNTALEVIWDQADTNARVSGYELNRNGSRLWLGDVTRYFDAELSPGINNSYTVVAVDENGARSANSRVVSVSDNCYNASSTSGSSSCTSVSFSESRPSKGAVVSGVEDVSKPIYSKSGVALPRKINNRVVSYDANRDDAYLLRTDRQSFFDSKRLSGYDHQYKIVAIGIGGNQLGAVMIDVNSASAAAKYDVYRNGHWIATTNGRSYNDAGLGQNSYYEYAVYKIENGTSQLLGSATIATAD